MKRTLSLIALVAICFAMMVSCKSKQSEPTPEEIEAQKLALTDSVLAYIDEIADKYIAISDTADLLSLFTLSESEKMVKPDYLLDPSEVNNFITKRQKVYALGFYSMDYYLLKIYDMPTDATKEAIVKLVAELDFPFEQGFLSKYKSSSEMLKDEYRIFKERGETECFWHLMNAASFEIDYFISQNPDLFYKYISDEANVAENIQWDYLFDVIKQLAQYDEDFNTIYNLFMDWYGEDSTIDVNEGYYTVESAIATYKENCDKYIEYRNRLLK